MFHRYPKMYVVRPQFFIPIITLLRNAAMKSLGYKKELALVRSQNIDITNFEDDLAAFKNAFAKNYDRASTRFQTAIDEIDKSILHCRQSKAEKCSYSLIIVAGFCQSGDLLQTRVRVYLDGWHFKSRG